jgi:APA family basic amino acid/polyamine antiporter
LHKGTEASAAINSFIVVVKMIALTMFILIGAFYVNPENWVPFIPENTGVFGEFGASGIVAGAAMVLLAFSGFDVVATAAQEARDPQRDLPIGILGSLAIATVIYALIAAVLTGIVKYDLLNVPQPIALAIETMNLPWFATIIKISAVIGLTSVILALMYAAIRVFFTITNDGLLPKKLSAMHKRNHTPYYLTFGVGSVVALLSSVFPSSICAKLSSFGISATFAVACLSTIMLRINEPKLEREFKCPLFPLIPISGMILFGSLMVVSIASIYQYLALWLVFTLSIYFGYSRFHGLVYRTNRNK